MKTFYDQFGKPLKAGYKASSLRSRKNDFLNNVSSIEYTEEDVLSSAGRNRMLSVARDSLRNNIITASIMDCLTTNIGSVAYKSVTGNEDYDNARNKYFKKYFNHIEVGGYDISEVIGLVIRELALSGDCLVLQLRNGLCQLIPSERIASSPNPKFQKPDETAGLRVNKTGKITHFRIVGYSKNGGLDYDKGTYIPAKDAIFIRNVERISSLRGVGYIWNCLPALTDLLEIQEAYTQKIKVSSLFAAYITSNNAYSDRWNLNEAEEGLRSTYTELNNGQLMLLEDGETMGSVSFGGNAEVKEYLLWLTTWVASSFGLNLESCIGYSSATFASSRISKSQSNFRLKRYRQFLENNLLKRLVRWKNYKGEKEGDLEPFEEDEERFENFSLNWTTIPSLDEKLRGEADKLIVENNLASYSTVFAERGLDFEEELPKIARDKKLLRQMLGEDQKDIESEPN
jgi:capsid protein